MSARAAADSLAPLQAYCHAASFRTMRSPSGHLSHPFLVPGGAYGHQLWDWDSYWVFVGLTAVDAPDAAEYRDRLTEHAVGSWLNFFSHQADNGAVPLLIEADRVDLFNCRREDGSANQAKPILAQFALAIVEWSGTTAWLTKHFDGLVRFLERWWTKYRSQCGLLVWGSDVASGVDNDPTVFGRPPFSSAGVLLNALYVRELEAAAVLARRLGRSADAQTFDERRRNLIAAINQECWDPIDGFYYTADVLCSDQRDVHVPGDFAKGMDMSWRTLPLKVRMFTGFLPLWAGAATPEQAHELMTRHWRSNTSFRAPFGVRSLANLERMYAPEVQSMNPSNWLGPVWLVASYLVYAGMIRYGFVAEASELARVTHGLLLRDLNRTQTLHECYHPDTGEPNFNAGFLSWNTLALQMKA